MLRRDYRILFLYPKMLPTTEAHLAEDDPDPKKSMEELLASLSQNKSESRLRSWIDIGLKTAIAIFVAASGYALTRQKQQTDEVHARQVQTSKDVRFVVDLIDGDPTRRAIGVAIAKAYAGADRIPVEVYSAVVAFTTSNDNLSQAADSNAVSAQIPAIGLASGGVNQQSLGTLPIRIYIQYQRAEDEGAMATIRQTLNGTSVDSKTLIVPPTEHVKIKISQPLLKCFRQAECDKYGNDLVNLMKAAGAPAGIKLQYIPGFESSTTIRDNHFEAWIGSLSS